jgi:hypothetical protein
MKQPCRHCGRLYTVTFAPRSVEDHDCLGFRSEPAVTAPDPSFMVVPRRSEADIAYALGRYRRALRWR